MPRKGWTSAEEDRARGLTERLDNLVRRFDAIDAWSMTAVESAVVRGLTMGFETMGARVTGVSGDAVGPTLDDAEILVDSAEAELDDILRRRNA